MGVDLQALARTVRDHPGVAAKAEIGLVSEVFPSTDWMAGPGDDGAVVTDQGVSLVVGGEAILPSFVTADPYGAGVAAVTTNVNDLAAMGAWPLALVDTVTGPREVIRRVLEGMRWASGLYDVPVVGGHLTVTEGPPGLSAFGLGRADFPLSAQAAASGQSLMIGCCLDGQMRPDFPFFPSFDERGTKLAGDVRLLAEGAEGGWVAAAKDVSMAGLVGSLAMLLECNRLGVSLDLDALPVPAGVTLERWINCFPCLSFLMCVPPGREEDCLRAFGLRGLAAAAVGTLDDTGLLRLSSAGQTETVFDLAVESVTNLARPRARAARRQVDEHALVREAGVVHQVPGPPPAQPAEEGDVGGLDEGLHLPAAEPGRRADREPDQRGAQAEMAMAGQYGQAVALPPAPSVGSGVGSERVEPYRAADGLVRPADDVDRGRVVVVHVGVVAAGPAGPAVRAAEHALLDDEDLVPDPEVRAPFGLGGHGIAGQQLRRRRPGRAPRQANGG